MAHETEPIWSPDGKWIVFRSDRHGNYDLFFIPADGGFEARITHHSSHDSPCCFTADGKSVLFSSTRLDAPTAAIASSRPSELYRIPMRGGRPRQMLTVPAVRAKLSPDGTKLAYEDRPGFEQWWRKHHQSSAARDVWVYDVAGKKHQKLTANRGEDRNAVWSADGDTLYFLSERDGSFNVYSRPSAERPGGKGQDGRPRSVPITRHAGDPVRFLSIARDNTLAYAYAGGLFVKRQGSDPKRIAVDVAAGVRTNAQRLEVFRDGATEMRVSPDEKEIAFVVRGEVFVASVAHGTTKRVTDTPQQERNLCWAPDGRTLYFAAERGESWDILSASIKRKEEEHFFQATVLTEAAVLATPAEEFQPEVSPDGKTIAYLHDRDAIHLLDLATKKTRIIVPASHNYSYSDGDVEMRWSPDGRWLATTMINRGTWSEGVGVVEVATGKLVNMTRSGYYTGRPRWSPDGRFVAYFSTRFGRRNHGSWGADGDLFAIDLTQEAHDVANLSEEEYELRKEREEEKEKDKRKKGKDGDNGDDGNGKNGKKRKKKEKKPPAPVEIEFDGRDERVRRLTLHSSPIQDYAIAPDGESVVYWARVGGKWDVWLHQIRKGETKRLVKAGGDAAGSVVFGEDGDDVFVRFGNGGLSVVPLKKDKPKPVKYAAEMTVDGPAERRYIFEHCWRQTKRKFYRADLHGVDWTGIKKRYAAYLGHIENNHDFAELLSEMVGELNASHTGSGYRIPQKGADKTASLGLLYEINDEEGWRVAEVLERGPCDRADSHVAAGARITHIDGVELTDHVNPFRLLNRKAGKRVLLTIEEAEGGSVEQVVKPVSSRAERDLLYRRWVRLCEKRVAEWSHGKVGYVHVRGMNDRSFREVYHRVLGRHGDKQALIVDTRFNGGGWLHDDLVKFLGGKRYTTFHPRGKERGTLGGDPSQRWSKPVVVVQSQANYSDAHIFPYAFKQLGIGKLVGAPVAGTGTAVWWESQIDRTLYYGIPQVGMVDPQGRYLENLELQPDVLVYNDPNDRTGGVDAQLKKAVDVVLGR